MMLPTEHPLVQALAADEHKRWSRWQAWMHGHGRRNQDGSITIPAYLVARWERQFNTDYADLSEREQASDVLEVEHIIRTIIEAGYVVVVQANGPAVLTDII